MRGKDAEANEKLFVKISDAIKAAGVSHSSLCQASAVNADKWVLQPKVGVLPKDTSSGPFIEEWKKIYGTISKDVEEIDIAPALSAAALAVKDENELVRIHLDEFWQN